MSFSKEEGDSKREREIFIEKNKIEKKSEKAYVWQAF